MIFQYEVNSKEHNQQGKKDQYYTANDSTDAVFNAGTCMALPREASLPQRHDGQVESGDRETKGDKKEDTTCDQCAE